MTYGDNLRVPSSPFLLNPATVVQYLNCLGFIH